MSQTQLTVTSEELPGGTPRVSFGQADTGDISTSTAAAAKAEQAGVRTKVITKDDRVYVSPASGVGVPNDRGDISTARSAGGRMQVGADITVDSVIDYPGFGTLKIRDAINAGLVERTASGFRAVGATSGK